jgi:hypothetical protein
MRQLERPAISWEVLRRSARRMLAQRFERGATAVGVVGPLLICGWTVARPFDLRQSYHHLVQCLIWLAAWYTLFAMFYIVLTWMRPRRHREGEDLAHLPLPATHFLVQRAIELGLVPLRCLALSLPLWFIVIAYIGIPYGEQWVDSAWTWAGAEVPLLWVARIGWSTANLLAATLLPLGVALLISETVRSAATRILLLVLPAAGLYLLVRFYEEHFRMPYRATVGYPAGWFLLVPLLLLCALTAGQLISVRVRLALLTVAGMLAVSGAFLLHTDNLNYRNRVYKADPMLRCFKYSAVWLAGQMDPPHNVRLLMDSLQSNVLLVNGPVPTAPDYAAMFPDANYDEAGYKKQHDDYQEQYELYEKRVAAMPRIAMWFGAGLMPLLVPLLSFAGLMLGARKRGFERAEG